VVSKKRGSSGLLGRKKAGEGKLRGVEKGEKKGLPLKRNFGRKGKTTPRMIKKGRKRESFPV